MKYLYGAAVQGIQGYIFQTNELKEIIGASEIVQDICTSKFKEVVGPGYDQTGESVIAAAGNIKYIFDRREDCERVVKKFPKVVVESAPGITVSQAVVEMRDDQNFQKAVDELKKKLRTQRNIPMRSTTLGCIGILRSRSTGMPVVSVEKDGEYLDEATMAKRNAAYNRIQLCQSAFGMNVIADNFPFDISEICGKNSWIAVIHADGNGLGKIVRSIGRDKDTYKDFSISLDRATKNAAQLAFGKIHPKIAGSAKIPVRPIVLGGDDFTMICRGDIAVEYTAYFLQHFEEETTMMLHTLKGNHQNSEIPFNKLTACAGIAFIKSNYPFYYGYALAETLCSESKKVAKRPENMENGLAKSCLMFHKVQDSYVTDFKDIEKRELKPCDGISYKFGPYYLNPHDGSWTIAKLLEYPRKLTGKDGNAVRSTVRTWMTCLAAKGEGAASQMKDRASHILINYKIMEELTTVPDHNTEKAIPAYDVLALCSIINNETR